MISVFFASVVVFIFFYGKCRQWLLEANRAANTAKSLYNDNTTLLADWNDSRTGPILSSRDRRDKEFRLQGSRDN